MHEHVILLGDEDDQPKRIRVRHGITATDKGFELFLCRKAWSVCVSCGNATCNVRDK